MTIMAKESMFEKWFNRLIRNKMRGPALATAGIALGLTVAAAGTPLLSPIDWYVALIGVYLSATCSLLFSIFVIFHLLKDMRRL